MHSVYRPHAPIYLLFFSLPTESLVYKWLRRTRKFKYEEFCFFFKNHTHEGHGIFYVKEISEYLNSTFFLSFWTSFFDS